MWCWKKVFFLPLWFFVSSSFIRCWISYCILRQLLIQYILFFIYFEISFHKIVSNFFWQSQILNSKIIFNAQLWIFFLWVLYGVFKCVWVFNGYQSQGDMQLLTILTYLCAVSLFLSKHVGKLEQPMARPSFWSIKSSSNSKDYVIQTW